jgi:hypothetical protein
MGIEVEVVSKPEFDGRNNVVDERFGRDRERIECLEDVSKQMVNLSTQFAEIIKSDHEKALQVSEDINDLKGLSSQLSVVVQELQKKDEDKEARLKKMEEKPEQKYDRLVGWIGGTAVGALVLYLINIILNTPQSIIK